MLPHLLNVGYIKGAKKSIRTTKVEARDAFIAHVKSDCELSTSLADRKNHCAQLGITLQPSVVIVGPSLSDITSVFVVVDQVRYRLPDIVSGVDTCFKVMWAMNAQYPPEANNIWYLLQVWCYQLRTEFDQISTTVNSLLTQLGTTN